MGISEPNPIEAKQIRDKERDIVTQIGTILQRYRKRNTQTAMQAFTDSGSPSTINSLEATLMATPTAFIESAVIAQLHLYDHHIRRVNWVRQQSAQTTSKQKDWLTKKAMERRDELVVRIREMIYEDMATIYREEAQNE